MVNVVSSLAVQLTAESAQLRSGLDKARRRTRSWSQSVRKQVDLAAKSFGAMGVAGAAAASAIYVANAKSIDQQAKFADQIGFTVGELKAWRTSAELTGVAQGTLDASLSRFVKRLGEAKQGFGAAKKQLDALGLSADYLTSLPTAQAMSVVADRIGRLSSETEKAAAISGLFGREGLALANTFADGSKVFQKTSEDIEALGGSITRANAAAVESANDAITRARLAIDLAEEAFTVQAAPYVDALVSEFVDAAKAAGGFGQIATNVMETVALSAGRVGDVINGLRVAYQGVKTGILGIGAVINRVIAGEVNTTIRQIQWFIDRINDMISAVAKASGGLVDIGQINVQLKPFDQLTGAARRAQRAFDEASVELQTMLLAPTSSAEIQQWFDGVRAKAEAAAEAVAKARPGGEQYQPPGADAAVGEPKQSSQEQFDAALQLQAQRDGMVEAAHIRHLQRIRDADKKLAADRQQIEASLQEQIAGMRSGVVDLSIGLLRQLGGENEKFAKLAIVVEKGLAIARAVQNTAVGVTKALAIDPTGTLATRVKILGAAQVALIAATGIGQLSSAGTGGGGGGGAPAIPAEPDLPDQAAQPARPELHVTVEGVLTQQVVDDVLIPRLRDSIDRDVIIVGA